MKKLFMIVVLAVLLLPPAALAQDLTESYTAPDGSFSFRYPAEWTLAEDGTDLILRSPEGLMIVVMSPDVVSRVAANLTPAETLDLLLTVTQAAADTVEEISVGGYPAARVIVHQDGPRETAAVIVRYSNTSATILLGVADAEQLAAVEAVALAMAASLNAGSVPAESATAEAAPDATVEPLPEGILFRDDFEGGLKDEWAAYQGMPSVVADGGNNALQVGGDEAFYVTTGADWTDYTATLRMKITQGDGISGLVGVRFDIKQVGAYAAFFDTGDDSAGLAYFFGTQTFNILSTSRVNLEVGQWYDLKVTAQGDQIELYFGGQRTNWLTSTQFKQGTLLVYAAPGTEILVDDVVIRDLSG
ncbi:MAG: hypothetical protein HXY41_07475 [Chloroflexi bacterium]|nr:hypothetical protein [Chloroflexota bacterium]